MPRAQWIALIVIVAALAALRFSLDSGYGPFGVDGSYYLQVARHVASGDGLLTSVCLYHQGLPVLPAPTNVQPLWPVVLGGIGRVTGLEAATHHLPRLLYLADLLLLFFLAHSITKSWTGRDEPFIPHLVVVMFATNPLFFSSTTFPYTEGLAFLIAIATLLVIDRSAFAAGVLAALAMLSRSQMLMLIVGIFIAIAIMRRWRSLAAYTAGVVLVLGGWLTYVSTFAPFSIRLLWDIYPGDPHIKAYQQTYLAGSLGELLVDRMQGLLVAFNIANEMSFVRSFGIAALLVPIAIAHFAWRWSRRRESPNSLVAWATILSGLFLCAVLLLTHQRFFLPWLFGWRHGLPLIFLMVPALAELIGRAGRVTAMITMGVCVISIFTGGLEVARMVAAGPPPGPRPVERAFVSWLNRNAPHSTILTTNAQTLSAYSRANFRWLACDDGPDVTRAMFRYVKSDYLAAYEPESACGFLRDRERDLEVVQVFGAAPDRIILLRPR